MVVSTDMTKEEYKIVSNEMGKDALKAMGFFFVVLPLGISILLWLFIF